MSRPKEQSHSGVPGPDWDVRGPERRGFAGTSIRDLRMVQQLEEIRLRRLQLTEGSRGFDYEATDLAYAAAFRHYGIDIEERPVDESAGLIRSHPGVAIALVAALDDWMDCRNHLDDIAGATMLTNVCQAADPDPRRHRVRAALSQNDWETLAGLATSIDVEDLPSPTLLLLYAGLQAGERQDLGLQLLLRGQ